METLAEYFLILPAFVVAYVGSLFGLAQVLSSERLRRVSRGRWPLRLNLWHMMSAVAVAAFVILAFERGYEVALALTLISLFVIAWFVRVWCHEFVFLMGLRDDDFPGRNDKLIWVIVLLAFAPIGPWIFRSYRLAHWPEPVTSSQLHPEPPGMTATQPARA